MTIYTFLEAQKNFASLLTKARKEGKVLIKRRDGSLFSLTPERESSSPLDVKGIKTKASTEDILTAVRESRRGV